MESGKSYTLCKGERLCGEIRFGRLMAEGEGLISYPWRVAYRFSDRQEGEYPARMAVSVSRKRFKRAVRRNRLKRLAREAYRLHKHQLYAIIPEGKTLDLLFIYLDKALTDFPQTEKAITGAIHKIHKRMERASCENPPVAD